MPIPAGWVGMFADMRAFARDTHLGKTGFYTIRSGRGSIPIWIDQINECDDEQLVALILKRITE